MNQDTLQNITNAKVRNPEAENELNFYFILLC